MNFNYVLDSYAWAEFFDGTPQGKKVKDILEEATVATSVIALAELSDKCAKLQHDFEQLHSFITEQSSYHTSYF